MCMQCSILQSFLLHASTLMLLCAAAALHVTIEGNYDVKFFLTKSVILSFGELNQTMILSVMSCIEYA